MPRTPSITQEDVNAICDKLVASGGRPSVRKIIEEHGSGSQGTVYPLFEKWRGGQERPTENSPSLSPVLQRALLEFVNRETSVAKMELEAQLAESKQVAVDLARENNRQVVEIDQLTDDATQMMDTMAGLQGKIEQLEKDLAVAHVDTSREREKAEQARTELAVSLLRLEAMPRLEADILRLTDLCTTERNARVASEQAAAVAAAQRDDKVDRLIEAKDRTDQLAEKLDAEQASYKNVTVELNNANVRFQACSAQLESTLREFNALKAVEAELRAEFRVLTNTMARGRAADET